MGFKHRSAIAQQFENDVEAYIKRCKYEVAKNGTEHTHPGFVDNIRDNDTPAAKFIRFAPDGVARKNDCVIHWEAKCGSSIERDAYENYMRYHEMGCRVLVFFKPSRRWGTGDVVFRQFVEGIEFIPSEYVVNNYPTDRRHPIIDGWMYPRKNQNRIRSAMASGTPYKEILKGSLIEVPDFYTPKDTAA